MGAAFEGKLACGLMHATAGRADFTTKSTGHSQTKHISALKAFLVEKDQSFLFSFYTFSTQSPVYPLALSSKN